MKATVKLRQLWHDAYYKFAPVRGVRFAMTCRDVTENIDLGQRPVGLVNQFRFWLHLSLCQACKSYLELSEALSKAIRAYAKEKVSPIDIERLNQNLLKNYSQDS